MQLVPAFLSPDELADLRRRAEVAGAWTPGRQGTGYDILPLRAEPIPAIARALALLGTPFEQYWDAYLIRYLDGAHIPPHVDPAQHGRRHRRLNAMLTRATRGGELRIDGALVELELGDAVLFYPDEERHEVAPVVGTRLLFSVGAWI
jgi:predicted 2-oxoglutarate/Fe(II)-dependent dioxygenase YbiX